MATHLDDMDSEEFVRLSLNDSTYAKVIFNDVKDFYLTNEDVNCAFTMMSSVEPMAGDKVALYKVGWSCAEDYIIAQPCKVATSQLPVEMSVTFSGSSLPKDDGEYYQFCYITANDEIRGGSTPFVFKNFPVEDLFSEEDIENDLMLIQTRTSILEGSLQKAIKERTDMQMEKQRLEKDCDLQKAKIVSFESLVKDQEEKIMELELKLKESKTNAVTNEDMLKEEIAQLNHFINGMKVAVSTISKEKTELEKSINELNLEKEASKENLFALQIQLSALISVERTLHSELQSKVEIIASLQKQHIFLKEDLSAKLSHLVRLEEEQCEQQLHFAAVNAQLADKEVMLAAMADSKSLAAEELQKCTNKLANIEADKVCLSKQCEKYKTEIDTLEEEKMELCKQLEVSVSENAVLKKEIKVLIEKQNELQENSSKHNLEVKDLQNRLALGGEEYRRKYIEWHKMQNKVLKLQKKLLNLQVNRQSGPCAANLKGSASSFNGGQGSSSDAQDSSSTLGDLQSDGSENEVPLSTKNTLASTNLNQEQSAKIHAAMENQLQKFHGTKESSNSLTDINVRENEKTSEGQSITSSTFQKPYPYPPYYPYPYPQGLMTDSCSSLSRNSGDISSLSYFQQQWLSSGNNEGSFIMVPSPNIQVLAQENVQPPNIQIQPLLEVRPGARTQEEETSSLYITCPICEMMLPEYGDINEHIDAHLYFKCPVCHDHFNKEVVSMERFNRHVLDHLD